MRELKFRAWDKLFKEMFDVPMLSNKAVSHAVPQKFMPDGVPLAQVELMQYTGLKDKQGKEIYEGDIVKVDEIWIDKKDDSIRETNPFIGEIRFSRYEWIVSLKQRSNLPFSKYLEQMSWGNGWEDWNGDFVSKTRYENIEVIGNIYEGVLSL